MIEIKRTQEIFTYQFELSHPATSGEFTKHLVKKWIGYDVMRNELGLLRDAIKQGKPALPCVDVLLNEIDNEGELK